MLNSPWCLHPEVRKCLTPRRCRESRIAPRFLPGRTDTTVNCTLLAAAVTTCRAAQGIHETMAFRCSSPREARELDRESLIRRMERLLERPLTPEEIRLILLAETVRDELQDNEQRAA